MLINELSDCHMTAAVKINDLSTFDRFYCSKGEVASGAHTVADLQIVNCRTDGRGHCDIIDLSVSFSTLDERAEHHMDTEFC